MIRVLLPEPTRAVVFKTVNVGITSAFPPDHMARVTVSAPAALDPSDYLFANSFASVDRPKWSDGPSGPSNVAELREHLQRDFERPVDRPWLVPPETFRYFVDAGVIDEQGCLTEEFLRRPAT